MQTTQPVEEHAAAEAPKRDWVRLLVAHLKVIALSPVLATWFYMLFGPERATLLTLKGIFTFLVGTVCTYIFFGALAAGAVLIVTPAVSLLTKITSARAGFLSALIGGTLVGWGVCLFIKDLPAFQYSAAVTTGIGCCLLERAWRRSWTVF